jgi:hypothetical protein
MPLHILLMLQCPEGSFFTSGSCTYLKGMGRLASAIPDDGTGAVAGFACGSSANVGAGQANTTTVWAQICCCNPNGWGFEEPTDGRR